MGISFFHVSSRTPTKTSISECKFLVPHAMCSKDGPWKGIPYSEKKTVFLEKNRCISCQYCLESNLQTLQCYLRPLPYSATGCGDFAPSRSGKRRSYFPIILCLKCSAYYRNSIVTSYQSRLAYYNGISFFPWDIRWPKCVQ